MDDDRLAAIVFFVSFGILLTVKGVQNLVGNIESSIVLWPFRWVGWSLVAGLVIGLVLGVVFGQSEPSGLQEVAAICSVG